MGSDSAVGSHIVVVVAVVVDSDDKVVVVGSGILVGFDYMLGYVVAAGSGPVAGSVVGPAVGLVVGSVVGLEVGLANTVGRVAVAGSGISVGLD